MPRIVNPIIKCVRGIDDLMAWPGITQWVDTDFGTAARGPPVPRAATSLAGQEHIASVIWLVFARTVLRCYRDRYDVLWPVAC